MGKSYRYFIRNTINNTKGSGKSITKIVDLMNYFTVIPKELEENIKTINI